MSNKTKLKPVALAVGAAFATTLAMAPIANAASNPFAMNQLDSGYKLAASSEGNCGANKAKQTKEANCGANKAKEKAKEANCGANKAKEKAKEANCGANKS
jgi:uncharacterized low-complexity protein